MLYGAADLTAEVYVAACGGHKHLFIMQAMKVQMLQPLSADIADVTAPKGIDIVHNGLPGPITCWSAKQHIECIVEAHISTPYLGLLVSQSTTRWWF